MKNFYDAAIANSMAVALMVATGAIIVIVTGALEFTTMKQMTIIMAAMYGFCRLYQRYEREFEPDYSLMDGKNLEKLFIVLTLFIMSVALYVDVCAVMRF